MPVARGHVQTCGLGLVAGGEENLGRGEGGAGRDGGEGCGEVGVVAGAGGVEEVVDFVFCELGRHFGGLWFVIR